MSREILRNHLVMWLALLLALLLGATAIGNYFIRLSDEEYVIWPNLGTIPRNAVEVEVQQVKPARYGGGSLSVARTLHVIVPCPGGIIRTEWLFPDKTEEIAVPIGSTDPAIRGPALDIEDIEQILHIVYFRPPPGADRLQWRVLATDRECADHRGRNQIVQMVGIPGREHLAKHLPQHSPIGEKQ